MPNAPTTIGMNVLVVDDQPLSREALSEALRPLGCRIRQVAGAAEALEELRLNNYPLMFIDLVMTGMDGYALARQIRRMEDEAKRPHASLVAYSGSLYAEKGKIVQMEQDRLLENGFDDGLAKPLNMESLQGVIDHVMENIVASPATPSQQPSLPDAPLPPSPSVAVWKLSPAYDLPNPVGPFTRALVVDDDRFSLATAEAQVLGVINHVLVAKDAEEALKQFCEQPFDLVLLDLEMPGTDGFSLARQLRTLEAGSPHRTCLVALSGNLSTPEMLRKCAAAGMDDCLTKPFNAKLFRLRLELWQKGQYPAQRLLKT